MTATIDTIINELAKGVTISTALSTVYTKRKVTIPYKKQWFDIDVRDLGLDSRSSNALKRAHLDTLNDLMAYIEDDHKPIDIRNLGVGSGKKLMEKILDYAWTCMDDKEKAEFLIDAVVMNEQYLRA
jgi:DNA-directed RNA polymerase alpha subunit